MAKIIVVYGSPCSGKSTYVNSKLADNDIKFDYDAIIQAISNVKSREYNDLLLPYVVAYRELIANKAHKDDNIKTAYIIASKLTDKLLEDVKDVKPEFYLKDTSKEQCMEYLAGDDTRPDKSFWETKINDWFDWYAEYNQREEENKIKHKAKKQFDFTNAKSGKKAGALELIKNSNGTATLNFYGDIVSNSWQSYFYEEDKCPQDISDFLKELDECQSIDININSGGGSVFGGLAIYNILKKYKGFKTVHIIGIAASIATVIALAGDKIYINKNAQFMIHKPSSWIEGDADEMRKTADALDVCQKSITLTYMQHVKDGVTEKQITDLINQESWFTGEEAATLFNIEVEEEVEIAASASDFFEKYSHTPPLLINRNEEPKNHETDTELEELQIQLELLGL